MFEVFTPQTDLELERYYDLRWRILRAPWGQPRGSERDEYEDGADHVAVRDLTGRLVGVGRLHLNSRHEAQIRYMAVEPAWRNRGVGRLMVARLEALARERGTIHIILNAREEVAAFYQRLGYRVLAQGPTLFGEIKHVRMGKDLPWDRPEI